MKPRTSLTHPLRIDAVDCLPFAHGTIGITFCPGKCGDSVHGAPWKRDLGIDLDAIQHWGASIALTLVEAHELELLLVRGLGDGFRDRGIRWYHLPIPDLQAPSDPFPGWADAGAAAVASLKAGLKVLVHCRGGLGRAGTVSCMLLRELGAPAAAALKMVRTSRVGSVETPAQARFVHSYHPGSLELGVESTR